MAAEPEPDPYRKLKPGPSLPQAEVAADQHARIHAAMIQIVAERGYGAVKIRDVVALAGVSSRSFYKHFDSKEECFVRTYETIVSRARIGLIAAQMDGKDWRDRPRKIFAAFARELEEDPAAARLALVDVYADGPEALERAHRAESNFTTMIGKSMGRGSGGIAVPALVVEGMIAGVARVARGRLLAGTEATLPGAEDEMVEWALSLPSAAAEDLVGLDLGLITGAAAVAELRVKERALSPAGDDRSIILAAIPKLSAADGYVYADLTVPSIRRAAGISRRNFDTQFGGVEECFLAALDLRSGEAVADAATEQAAGLSWGGGVYRAISSLCISIAADPLLARVCFTNDFLPESKGALARLRLIAGVADQIRASAPASNQGTALAAEASAGAVWALFHHHVLRDWISHRPEIAATLAYMALAPALGGANAVAAIQAEQVA